MQIKNNNSGVITKLANHSFKNNKTRNYLLILSMIVMITLLFSIFSISITQVEAQHLLWLRSGGTKATITLDTPTNEQYQEIKQLDYIDYVGMVSTIGVGVFEENSIFSAAVLDKVAYEKLYLPAYTNINGNYPQDEKEVMMPMRALEALGIENPSVGMTITFDLNDGDNITSETFILSGYYTEYVDPHDKLPIVFFSENYLISLGSSLEEADVLVMKQKDSMLFEETEERLYNDIETINDVQQFYATDTYSYAVIEELYGDYDTAIVLGIIVIVSVSLLLNNIMQMSIEKDVRELGLLCTIGTTKKQVYKILQRQIIYISGVGIVIGSILSIGIIRFLLPAILNNYTLENDVAMGDLLVFRWQLLGIVIIFCFIIACISMLLPLIKIQKISPKESLYYIEGKAKASKKEIHVRKGSSILKMAWRNIWKNKLRFFKTITSLFIASILTIVSVMAVQILDYSNSYKNDPDFEIGGVYDPLIEETHDFLNKQFIDSINSIEDVNSTSISYMAYALFDSSEEVWQPLLKATGISLEEEGYSSYWGGFMIVEDDELKQLDTFIKENSIDIDMDSFINGESFVTLHHHVFSEKMQEEAETVKNKQVTFYNLNNEEAGTLSFGGYLDLETRGIPNFKNMATNAKGYPYILISEKGFEQLQLEKKINRIDINIKENKELYVEARLKQLLQDRSKEFSNELYVILISKYANIQEIKDYVSSIRVMLFSISALLMGMAIFNYYNVMHTSLSNRKRELVTLESIGMTRKQLRKMLVMEGLLYSGVVVGIMLSLGTGILFIASNFIQGSRINKVFTYPTSSVVILVTMMIIISFALPLVMYRRIRKESIISRMSN